MMLSSLVGLALASFTTIGEPLVPVVSTAELTPEAQRTLEPEAAAGVVRVYDVSSALPRAGAGSSEEYGDQAQRLLPQIVIGTERSDYFTGDGWEVEETGPEEIADFLITAMGDEVELEGRLIEFRTETELIVRGPEEFHARFSAVLASLEAFFSGSSKIRVEVYDFETAPTLRFPEQGALSVAEWLTAKEQLLAAGAKRTATTLILEEGLTATAHDSVTSTFVVGYDVEIAQGSFTFDPLPGQVRLGTRISAQGSPRAGGLALALAIGTSSLVGPMGERNVSVGGILGSETAGSSHLNSSLRVGSPEVASSVFVSDAFLPDGHVLLMAGGANLSSGHTSQVIAISRVDSGGVRSGWITIPGTDRKYFILPAGALAGPHVQLSSEGLWAQRPGSLNTHVPRGRDESQGHGVSVHFPGSWEWLDNVFEYAVDPYPAQAWRFGPWLVASGEGGALDALVAPGNPAVEVSEALTIDLALSDGRGGTPATARVALRTGGQSMVALGSERPAILDFDVEVAQHAAVADPAEFLVFDGTAVRLSAKRGAAGAIYLEVSVRCSLEEERLAPYRLQGLEGLEVDRAEHREFTADGRFVLPPNSRQGSFTLGGEPGDGTLSLTITVR